MNIFVGAPMCAPCIVVIGLVPFCHFDPLVDPGLCTLGWITTPFQGCWGKNLSSQGSLEMTLFARDDMMEYPRNAPLLLASCSSPIFTDSMAWAEGDHIPMGLINRKTYDTTVCPGLFHLNLALPAEKPSLYTWTYFSRFLPFPSDLRFLAFSTTFLWTSSIEWRLPVIKDLLSLLIRIFSRNSWASLPSNNHDNDSGSAITPPLLRSVSQLTDYKA